MADLYYEGNINIYLYGDFALEIQQENEEYDISFVSGVNKLVVQDFRKPKTAEEFIIPSYCKIYITEKSNDDITLIDCIDIILKPFDETLPKSTMLLDMGTCQKGLKNYPEYIFAGKKSKFNSKWVGYVRLIETDTNKIKENFPKFV